jgi:hypothetical protein
MHEERGRLRRVRVDSSQRAPRRSLPRGGSKQKVRRRTFMSWQGALAGNPEMPVFSVSLR